MSPSEVHSSPRRRWFDRRFELGLPREAFPDILERVRGTPARLEERVRDLTAKTHEARHNERPLEDLLSAFRSARLTTVERLEALGQADLDRTALHPRLAQPMSVIDHFFFVAEHDDHHLAAIGGLIRARST